MSIAASAAALLKFTAMKSTFRARINYVKKRIVNPDKSDRVFHDMRTGATFILPYDALYLPPYGDDYWAGDVKHPGYGDAIAPWEDADFLPRGPI